MMWTPIPSKIVTVTPIRPKYGTVLVNTDHIIAVNEETYEIIFENTIWELNPHDFDNVKNSWVMNTEAEGYGK